MGEVLLKNLGFLFYNLYLIIHLCQRLARAFSSFTRNYKIITFRKKTKSNQTIFKIKCINDSNDGIYNLVFSGKNIYHFVLNIRIIKKAKRNDWYEKEIACIYIFWFYICTDCGPCVCILVFFFLCFI